MALLDPSLQYIELLVDSTLATSTGKSGETSLDFPLFPFTQKSFLCAGIKILSAEIPFTYHVINSTNNWLLMNGVTVEIPPGTYNADTLATVIKAAAEAQTGGTWTITWDNVSLKYTFSWTDGFITLATLDFNPQQDYKELQDILGLSQLSYATTTSFSSDKVASPMGPAYLHINSARIGRGIDALVPSVEDGVGSTVEQICRVPINVNYSDFIFYEDQTYATFFDFKENTNFNGFDLYITLGASKKPVKFNGLGFSVRLGLYVYRDASAPLQTRPGNRAFIS